MMMRTVHHARVHPSSRADCAGARERSALALAFLPAFALALVVCWTSPVAGQDTVLESEHHPSPPPGC